jgi:hypothetical protein
MLSLIRRRPRSPAAVRRRPVRLELEGLEGRDCPSAPVITSMSFTELPQRVVNIKGTVTDDHDVTQVQVSLSGVVVDVATVNGQGQFNVQLTAKGLGQVTAVAYDPQQQLASAPYVLQITSAAPVINTFTAVPNPDGTWTFSGHLTDAAPQGETVMLGGLRSLAGTAATVNSTGDFSVTIALQTGDMGTATAQMTDWWGQPSNQAQFVVRPV